MKLPLPALASLTLLTALPSRAAELEVRSFSGKEPVADPVAVAVDDRGVVYVTQTERRKTADLDIRQFNSWVEDDIHLTTIEAKRAFLRAALPEGRHTAKSGDLKDWNKDQRVDWHDLTVPSERVWRLEDTDGDGVADRRAVAAEGFNTEVTGIAAGIAAIQGSLYLTCAPDFWKLDDADGDGIFEKRQSLAHGFGHHIAYAGHDMHGPRLHPDGRVYWTIGDKGVSAAGLDGKRGDTPHQGALLRCEPDGSRFEVFAHGLRNPQEIAFDENGDFFAVDNDADHPGDRERFLHVIEGADYGWRNHYQYRRGEYFVWMEEDLFSPRTARQPAYFIPAIRSYSDGPAGFVFNPGTALGKGFENTFILGEFPSGKITAFRVEPDGAGFRMTGDRLVSAGTTAVGFNWGPDGALYAADWEAGYELNHIGAVKVFDVPDTARDSRRVETRRLLAEGMEKRSETELRDLLGHPDQRVRMRAQFALVARGAAAPLAATALDAKAPPLSRRHALWGIGQLARTRGEPVVVDAVRPLMNDADANLAGLAFTVVSEARDRAATDEDLRVWTAALTAPSPRLRLRAAEALRRAAKPGAVEPLLAFLRANQDQDVYLRNTGFRALAACADRARLTALARDEAPAVRRAAVLALREQADPGLVEFLADTDPSIAAEAARGIHDVPVPAALPALATHLARLDTLAPEALVRRAISANYRLGDEAALKRVIAFADTTRPGEIRDAALNALARWLKPGRTCLVDDSPVTLPARDDPALPAAVRAAWPALARLSSKRLADLRKAHGVALDLPATLATLRDEAAPEADRATACEALASDPAGTKPLRAAAPELLARDGTPPLLRLRLAEALGRAQPETAVKTLSALVAEAPVPVAQLAVGALADVQHAASDAALLALAAAPRDELVLELREALLARKKALKGAEAAAKALPTDPYRASLAGGDAARGREVVFTHAEAGCVRCHSIGTEGQAAVGPNLAGAGARHDARGLLESLLDPAAKVSPGFALTSVTTRDGAAVAGWWMAETATTLTVKLPEGGTKTLEKSAIASQTPPLSTMPPMGTVLTPRELRDVAAYLRTLK